MNETISIAEKRRQLQEELWKLDQQFNAEIDPLIEARNKFTDQLKEAEEKVKSLKAEQSLIDGELMQRLKDAGLGNEVTYSGGLRLEFKEEITGAIEPGMEERAIAWAKSSNNDDVIKISVGKTAFGKLIDSGNEVPECIKVRTHVKFNVRKDTRKLKG